MSPSSQIEASLAELDVLADVLSDEHTEMALVRADGTWHVEQNSAVRRQAEPLPADPASHFIDTIHRHGPTICLDRWWVRPMTAGPEGVAVFLRRPVAAPEGLSPHTAGLLNKQLPAGANGLIFGTSQVARSGLLLSMTRFFPQDLVAYVGPVPPIVPREVSLLHVLPPRHDRDRRELALLFERCSAVLYDGPIGPEDLRIVFAGSQVRYRWLAVDAVDPQRWRSRFGLPDGLDEPISTHIGVRSSPLKAMRIDYVSVRHDRQWEVLFEPQDLDDSSATSDEETTSVASDPRLSDRVTSPVHRNSRSSDEKSDEPHSGSDLDSMITDRLEPDSDFDVNELLGDEEEPEELLRESGEIDVPGFASKNKSGENDSEGASDRSSNELRGQRIDRDLPGLIASSDIDEVKIPELQPEQLRQTFDADVDIASLKEQKKYRSKRRVEPDLSDQGNESRSTAPNIPSRRIERSRELASDSSTPGLSRQERSGEWKRQPSSSGRVIPVRSSPTGDGIEPPTDPPETTGDKGEAGTESSGSSSDDRSRDSTDKVDVRQVLKDLHEKKVSPSDDSGN